ncbi:carboxypeptidase-like regulatory domain-containing protein [Hymenobacter metallilatus]|uniref:Carboxypeptidase-like regulatory domain-containing protein n=1 Tax=Hymenobacter metallilatus TaxID=2493666 RepID=A0A3R9MD53_9BACT|nr:carboxypeptidase-like regulatory domain-containing protein [Hymenobacter metallilatus]RSK37502.1 carboxypeptidase-like regulatory domain-containing protein [Hymenobacter metallilatus]
MPTRLTVSIPEPCHENWQAMTPAAQGRHCAACSQVVVDFTRMTDAEVVAYLSRPTGPGCGRFRAEQLSRPLRATAEAPASRRWLAAALAVLGVGATVPAVAQTKPAAPVEHQILMGVPLVPEAVVKPIPSIRGQVTDAATGEALPGVTVLLHGLQISVSTRSDGTFELLLPTSFTLGQIVEFHSIGFVAEEHSVGSVLAQNGSATIQLSPDVKGGLNYSPIYSPNGLWQRLISLFR